MADNRHRVYLDHAATSWPKLPGVVETAHNYLANDGTSAGRGNYSRSVAASESILATKAKLAAVFDCSRDEIAFSSNGTLALHAILSGLLCGNDEQHVVATAIEHNSVLRPLVRRDRETNNEQDGNLSIAHCDSNGFVSADEIEKQLTPKTRWIVISHASNVTGCIQDLPAIGELARKSNCHLIVDACQTAGIIDCSFILRAVPNVAAIATSGHKGLGGIFGTGVIVMAQKFQSQFRSPWIGGTGSLSNSTTSDSETDFGWADSIESGNKNVPAILSLGAAISVKQNETNCRLAALHAQLISIIDSSQLLQRVGPQLAPFGNGDDYVPTISAVPVVSVTTDIMSPSEFAAILDSEYNIEVRAGFHCSGKIHEELGTATDGTLRFSLGETSNESDLKHLDAALADIAAKI